VNVDWPSLCLESQGSLQARSCARSIALLATLKCRASLLRTSAMLHGYVQVYEALVRARACSCVLPCSSAFTAVSVDRYAKMLSSISVLVAPASRRRLCSNGLLCIVCVLHPYAGALSMKPYFHCCRLATEETARRGTGPSAIFTPKRVAAAVVSGRVCSSVCAACHFSFPTMIYGKLCEALISLIISVGAAYMRTCTTQCCCANFLSACHVFTVGRNCTAHTVKHGQGLI
jgi:hypothetical protein